MDIGNRSLAWFIVTFAVLAAIDHFTGTHSILANIGVALAFQIADIARGLAKRLDKMVLPGGIEPLVSDVKDRRPRPLDEGSV